MKTFREYLETRRSVDGPSGDFTEDAKRDKGMPDVKSWSELESYLRRKHACAGAIEGAYRTWRSYRRIRT